MPTHTPGLKFAPDLAAGRGARRLNVRPRLHAVQITPPTRVVTPNLLCAPYQAAKLSARLPSLLPMPLPELLQGGILSVRGSVKSNGG